MRSKYSILWSVVSAFRDIKNIENRTIELGEIPIGARSKFFYRKKIPSDPACDYPFKADGEFVGLHPNQSLVSMIQVRSDNCDE